MEINVEFFTIPEVVGLETCTQARANVDAVRFRLLLRLLTLSESGLVMSDHRQFARLAGGFVSKNGQFQTVWDYCVGAGILRQCQGGFSAADWMREHGLTSENGNRSNLTSETHFEVKACEYPSRPQNTSQNETSCKREAFPSDTPCGKIPVRENVHLTPAEIATVKRTYGEEVYDAILDRLSLYKKSSGKAYQSDAAAIDSWVARAVRDEARKKAEMDESLQMFQEASRKIREQKERGQRKWEARI